MAHIDNAATALLTCSDSTSTVVNIVDLQSASLINPTAAIETDVKQSAIAFLAGSCRDSTAWDNQVILADKLIFVNRSGGQFPKGLTKKARTLTTK
jgi:hypothetical protein